MTRKIKSRKYEEAEEENGDEEEDSKKGSNFSTMMTIMFSIMERWQQPSDEGESVHAVNVD